jgi:hypothetical protein
VGLLEDASPLPPDDPELPPALLSPVPPLVPELASEEGVAPAALPPELAPSPLAPPDCSPELELSSLAPAPVEALEPVVEVVAVVEVEVVLVASLSACVLLGGVISGVLRGTASATLPLPPQAPSARPARSMAALAKTAAASRRAVTSPAAPSGVRKSGSR